MRGAVSYGNESQGVVPKPCTLLLEYVTLKI